MPSRFETEVDAFWAGVATRFRSEMWIPTFSNSPWMRGAPQSGLAAAIFRIRALIAGLASGRPLFRLEIQVQKRRKPLRCQATTVVGLTMINTRCPSFQLLDSHTQRSDPSFAAGAAGTSA